MKVQYTQTEETVMYAASELVKYIERVTRGKVRPKAEKVKNISVGTNVITLALLDELHLSTERVEDAFIDDVIDIDINGLNGYIAGSNVRSILLGVYKYLYSAGCRWVRPGEDGEYIPECDLSVHSFKYRKKADYPFRGECIEGAVSFENVRDTIIWSPKVGLNMFMLEQIVPYNYMSRWYNRKANTIRKPEPVSFDQTKAFISELEKEIKKCGLQLHSMGHGYMFEPYGIHYKTGADKYEPSDKALSHMALVNGKRELFHGSPNFTQLCYSNEAARRKLVEFCADYAELKPYIDYLHIWLADAINNQCECDECVKKTPSDFYVMLLNEIDAEFTKRGIDMRIVFITYTDTIWPPESEKLINQERFTLLTAMSRSYNQSYTKSKYEGMLPKYERNKFNLPRSFPLKLAFYNEWKKRFSGKSIIFEYYFYTDHYNDPGYYDIAKILLQDIKTLGDLGFSGMISDQTQRSFFPTGFPMCLMCEALFDKNTQFDNFVSDYFHAAFGSSGMKCAEYLAGLSKLFDPVSLRDESKNIVEEDTGTGRRNVKKISVWKDNPSAAERFSKIPGYIDGFIPVIQKNLELDNVCHAKSWKYLKYHAGIAKKLAYAYYESASGNYIEAREKYLQLIDYISGIEDKIQPVFDLCLFAQLIGSRFLI